MDAKKRVVVAGARGVFGSLLVDELRGAYDVVATTRDTLDLRDVGAVANAARGAFAFACCAGPFQQLDRRIVRAVVNEGAHWLDIADDAKWFFDLIDDADLDAIARERNVVVMPGLSSLPAISCALVHKLEAKRAEITLFIGNDNRKGAGAIASGAALNAPDRELLRREGIDATVRAKFELPGAKVAMRALSALPLNARVRVAKTLSKLIPRFGRSGGYVEVNGVRIEGGQRMAILPLVFALEHLDKRGDGLQPVAISTSRRAEARR
ncbi:MAG TPA: hypothetical protein VM733_20040, partial [Thermoanaerobaculia bacterium]|nr:hypothetical protein [Thermoanaerobaculia bacterium]